MVAASDRNRPLYMISVAAELAGVHPQTLRAYEQKGLVTPQRTSGNTRMYSQADIDLTAKGINLAGVMRILDLQTQLDDANDSLENLRKRYHRLARRMSEIDAGSHSVALVRRADLPPVIRWLTS